MSPKGEGDASWAVLSAVLKTKNPLYNSVVHTLPRTGALSLLSHILSLSVFCFCSFFFFVLLRAFLGEVCV